jgi:HTH-type transcriptional regulator/antitoxin HigA
MSTTTIKRTRQRTQEAYFDLVRRFPLRPLRSEKEYDRAVAVLFELSEKGETSKLSRGERDYIDGLTRFIEDWDLKQGHLDTSSLTPLGMLEFLMDQHDMSTSDLGRVIGSQSAASLVRNGKRELSKAHLRALAAHFHVEPGLFFQ